MSNPPKRLDWAGALSRLERIRESLDRADQFTPDDLRRLYSERAARLARPADIHETGEAAELLMVFRLGEERYAIRASEVTEALPQPKLAPVPGAPATVAGVIQVRGEIRPVYNLRQHLGIAESPGGSAGIVVLLRTGGSQFGLRVDEIEEVRAVGEDDRRLPSQAAHVSWTTEDLVSVLNTESIWKREA